jgi:hypothetical protein
MCSLFGFSIKQFSYVFFIVKKWPLYVDFNIPFVENYFFLNFKLVSMSVYSEVYITHMGTKFQRGSFHICSKKWFFSFQNFVVLF